MAPRTWEPYTHVTRRDLGMIPPPRMVTSGGRCLHNDVPKYRCFEYHNQLWIPCLYRRPDNQTSRQPDIRTSRHPDVQASRPLGHWPSPANQETDRKSRCGLSKENQLHRHHSDGYIKHVNLTSLFLRKGRRVETVSIHDFAIP